jgi:Na+/melibiose symporter-like transporter
LYFIAGIIIIITITVTIITTPERQYQPKHKLPNPCVQLIRAIQTFPRPITLASIVQFLAFLGWFNIWMLFTTWMAKTIYMGDPNAPLNSPARNAFAEGVRAGNIGLMLLNIVCIPYSLILPHLMKIFGTKPVWLFGIGLLSVCLVLTLFITSKILAFILIGSLGISFATTLTIPWAIVNASLAHTNEKGIYTALFEIILSFPGIITGCTTGLAMRIFGLTINQTFALGAIPATLSLLTIFIADTSPIDEKKQPGAKEESEVMLQQIDEEESEIDE